MLITDNLNFEQRRLGVEMRMHEVWRPHSGQIPLMAALFHYYMSVVFLQCGRKMGKTDFAVWCMIYFGQLFPESQIYYIADTMKHGGELLWKNRRLPEFFLRIKRLPNEPDWHYEKRLSSGKALHNDWILKPNESEMRLYMKNGSWIKIDGAENYANADGIEPDFMVYDEFKHHTPKFHEAMEPNLEVKKAPLLILGTPPDNYANYYCKIADYVRKSKFGSFFELPSYLNSFLYPLGESDPNFQKQCDIYDLRGEEDVKLRELYAKIVVGGSSSIFPVFESPPLDFVTGRFVEHTDHVRPHDELMEKINLYPKDWDFYVSYDAGTVVCFAVVFIAINKFTKECLVLDEIYEENRKKTSTKFIFPSSRAKWRAIRNDDDEWYKIYDNAAAWFATEVANEYDVGLHPCTKDVKKKEVRLSLIKDMMAFMYLKVSDRCQKFVWEITNYRTDDKGRIPSENDHLIDAFRYALTAAGYDQVPEEQLDLTTEKRGYRMEDELHSDDDPMSHIMEEFYE